MELTAEGYHASVWSGSARIGIAIQVARIAILMPIRSSLATICSSTVSVCTCSLSVAGGARGVVILGGHIRKKISADGRDAVVIVGGV